MRAMLLSGIAFITGAALLVVGPAGAGTLQRPDDQPHPVPAEEYPVYDRVIQAKFLTSQTALVVIERLTVTRLGPDEEKPPSRTYFAENRFFEGALSPDLVTDFILKSSRSSRLEARFNFGVGYRFVSAEGAEEPEVSLAPMPARFGPRAYAQAAPTTVGILSFSRVAFTQRADQALVYVADNRPGGSGAGFLLWLRRGAQGWEILDTEVLWVARAEGPAPEER